MTTPFDRYGKHVPSSHELKATGSANDSKCIGKPCMVHGILCCSLYVYNNEYFSPLCSDVSTAQLITSAPPLTHASDKQSDKQ